MKLPLKEHVKMQGTTVLTVNHVYEILLKFRSTGSWPEAFGVLPDRKAVVLNPSSEDNSEPRSEQAGSEAEEFKH
jgi:tRNA (guanine9-N1)-methyltransferase